MEDEEDFHNFKERRKKSMDELINFTIEKPTRQTRAKSKFRGNNFGNGSFSNAYNKFLYEKSVGKFKLIGQKQNRRKK